MPSAASPYTHAWLEAHRWTAAWRTRALLAAFAHLGLPDSYLDVGCGDGVHVVLVAGLGLTAWGVDVALEGPADGGRWALRRADLTRPLDLGQRFALVTCWEVAEHLPAVAADILVDTVARHTGHWLVWTAATPGQGGFHHVNEQPPAYWLSRLTAHGLARRDDRTQALRQTWQAVCGPCWWYPKNVTVLERTSP
jgi:hypothetical protein